MNKFTGQNNHKLALIQSVLNSLVIWRAECKNNRAQIDDKRCPVTVL